MGWSSFKAHFRKTGRREEERVNLVDQLSVNGEYISTFRTNSYIEMLKKAHEYRLGTKSLGRIRSSSFSSSLPLHVGLCDYLLEPRQEILIILKESSDLHPLIVNFFEATFVACNICDLVLSSVDQVRSNYPRREEFNCKERESLACTGYTDAQCCTLLDELASFAMLKSPLLSISPSQFPDIHEYHDYLLQKLTMKCIKVKMRAKFTRCGKKTLGLGLVVSYTAIVTALLVLVVHSMLGIVAAPPVIACSLGLIHKWKKLIKRRLKTSSLERLGAQLEVVKKGIYILINDFDTMSRVVRRLEVEIEHIRVVSDVCVRNGKLEVVKKVVGEIGIDQKGFLDQLKEEADILVFSQHKQVKKASYGRNHGCPTRKQRKKFPVFVDSILFDKLIIVLFNCIQSLYLWRVRYGLIVNLYVKC